MTFSFIISYPPFPVFSVSREIQVYGLQVSSLRLVNSAKTSLPFSCQVGYKSGSLNLGPLGEGRRKCGPAASQFRMQMIT